VVANIDYISQPRTGKPLKFEYTSDMMEAELVDGIRRGDDMAFKRLFDQYYVSLSAFATEYVKSYDAGREVVQEVLLKIWNMRETWAPTGSLKTYLYRAVFNQALNYIKKEANRRRFEAQAAYESDARMLPADDYTQARELQRAIRDAVRMLPPKRQMIYVLHRQHGLPIKEIAVIMDISQKTVENQMGEALRFIRERLSGWSA
jgi:RNA polymerase sigma-70 factor (family 1)